jgi:hypothetical protein
MGRIGFATEKAISFEFAFSVFRFLPFLYS